MVLHPLRERFWCHGRRVPAEFLRQVGDEISTARLLFWALQALIVAQTILDRLTTLESGWLKKNF